MINLTRLWTGRAQPADDLRYGTSPTSAPASAARKPIVVWNLTRTCNLRCAHCYSDSMNRSYPGELNWEEMKAVADDLAAYRIPSLLFSGGEPLVHPRFFDLVDYASGRGLKLTISTNGTLLTPEKARRLKNVGVAYVGISLDGIGKIHDEFRGKEGAFDAAVRGFQYCAEAEQKTGLRMTLTRHNVRNIDLILDFIEKQSIQRVCFYHLVPAGRGSELQVLEPEETRACMDTLLRRVQLWHERGESREVLTVTQPADGAYVLLRMRRENHPNEEEAKRLLQWNRGGAVSSGRAVANIDTQGCVHPDQFWQSALLGNVKEQPFSEIWDGKNQEAAPLLTEIRAIASTSDEKRRALMNGPCASCDWFSLCGGGFRTRAAFANGGDFWGSDPACYLRSDERAAGLST